MAEFGGKLRSLAQVLLNCPGGCLPRILFCPRYLDDGSVVASDSFVLVALYRMNLYQGDQKLSVGDTIWNRPDDPPLIAVYDPDPNRFNQNTGIFRYKLPDEELAHPSDADLSRYIGPDQPDEDNIIDRRESTYPELIDAGAGDDMIITGGRNNIVLAGPGDDHIDLDSSAKVEYQVMQKDNICRL